MSKATAITTKIDHKNKVAPMHLKVQLIMLEKITTSTILFNKEAWTSLREKTLKN